MAKTKPEDLAAALDDIMSEYAGKVSLAAEDACKEVAKYAQKRLKETSPRGGRAGKHYANGWAVAVEKGRTGVTVRVWNKTKPGLTHLLENGHQKRNGGRTDRIEHIAPVETESEAVIGDKIRLEVEKI